MQKEGIEQDVLLDAFFSLGRLDNITMAMGLHPAYLSCFLRTQHALLDLDGPLPSLWRHYIVIMVRLSPVIATTPPPHLHRFTQVYTGLHGLTQVYTGLRGLHVLMLITYTLQGAF